MEKEYIIKSPGKTFLTLDNNSITITRKGMLNAINQGFKGEKTIPLKSITAVQLKKPGVTSGYIQFSLLGGNENRGGVFAATSDENTVMFTKKNYSDMQELKAIIEKHIFSENESNSNKNNYSEKSAVEQVKDMKELLDIGIITDEEFTKKRNELLGL
ncbi:DUF4429 domain-containing protein [Carnobacterium maltaromaticum]|uniref:DUF4429 domain-containing protein n=1 Tax=Vagococcus sp. TaxID=1933889 RepID=UPI0028E29586|nr:DUF4429 domain-containing protein [Carnobacterium maltaromaticum]